MVEAHLAADGRQRYGVRRVFHVGRCVEDLEDAFRRRRRHRNRRNDHADAAHGHDELAQVGGKGDQFAQGQLTADDQQPTIPDDRHRADVGDEVQHRHIDRTQLGRAHREVEPIVVLGVERVDLRILLGKGFDHACAAQILFHLRGQNSQLLLDCQRKRTQAPPELIGAIGEEGHRHHTEQRQSRIHQHEHDRGADDQYTAIDQTQHGASGEEAHAVYVLHRAGQQLTGFGAVVIGKGEVAQLGVDGVAQVERHVLRDDLAPTTLEKGQHALHRGQSH